MPFPSKDTHSIRPKETEKENFLSGIYLQKSEREKETESTSFPLKARNHFCSFLRRRGEITTIIEFIRCISSAVVDGAAFIYRPFPLPLLFLMDATHFPPLSPFLFLFPNCCWRQSGAKKSDPKGRRERGKGKRGEN